VFGVYVVYGIANDGIADAGMLIARILRGGVAAAISVGVAWLVLPAVAAVTSYGSGAASERAARRQRRREAKDAARRQRELQAEERRRQQELASTAPAREQQRLAAETTARQEATRRADEQRRREAVRLECQLLYDRHAVTLRKLFPRERLEHHLTQWLGDNRPADLVEQHAEKLRELMQELVSQSAGPRAKFNNLHDIAEHFGARRAEVDLLPFDEETKSTLRCAINTQETAAMQEFFRT
jgi:hypothetical protein